MSYENVDGEVATDMVDSDSKIVYFTTGRDSLAGHPTVLIIKITRNHEVYEKPSPITLLKIVKDVEEKLFDSVFCVACGEMTVAERLVGENLSRLLRIMV